MKTKMANLVRHGLEGRSFRETLLFYLIMLAPLLAIACLFALFLGKDAALQLCPLIAFVAMAGAYLISYFDKISSKISWISTTSPVSRPQPDKGSGDQLAPAEQSEVPPPQALAPPDEPATPQVPDSANEGHEARPQPAGPGEDQPDDPYSLFGDTPWAKRKERRPKPS